MSCIYCGIDEVPKGKRRGTVDECAKMKQIRYYGIKKIDDDYKDEYKGISYISSHREKAYYKKLAKNIAERENIKEELKDLEYEDSYRKNKLHTKKIEELKELLQKKKTESIKIENKLKEAHEDVKKDNKQEKDKTKTKHMKKLYKEAKKKVELKYKKNNDSLSNEEDNDKHKNNKKETKEETKKETKKETKEETKKETKEEDEDTFIDYIGYADDNYIDEERENLDYDIMREINKQINLKKMKKLLDLIPQETLKNIKKWADKQKKGTIHYPDFVKKVIYDMFLKNILDKHKINIFDGVVLSNLVANDDVLQQYYNNNTLDNIVQTFIFGSPKIPNNQFSKELKELVYEYKNMTQVY